MTQDIQLTYAVAAATRVGDFLRAVIINADDLATTLYLTGQLLTASGQISEISEVRTFQPATRSDDWIVPLTQGHILDLAISTRTTPREPAAVFVKLDISQGKDPSVATIRPLTHGYVSFDRPCLYPNAQPRDQADIDPNPTLFTPANPATGSSVVINFGAFKNAEITAAGCTLLTNAGAGDRKVLLSYDRLGINIARSYSRSAANVGETWNIICWAGPNMPLDTINTIYLPIPNIGPLPGIELTLGGDGFLGNETIINPIIAAKITAASNA